MLVLSRHRYEKIQIGDNVTVTVVEISPVSEGGKIRVKLGFDAPDEVRIMRTEIMEPADLADPPPRKW